MDKMQKMGREWTEKVVADMTLVSGGIQLEARGRTARVGRDGMDLPDTNAAIFGAAAPKVDTLEVWMEETCGCTRQVEDLRAVLAECVVARLAGTGLVQARLRLELLVGEVSDEAYETGDYWRVVQESISIRGTKEIIA